MAVQNINTPQRVGGIKVFSDAVANVCLNAPDRIIEAGVKERGYKIDGNPEEGSFRIGLKASPEETPSDITVEALTMALRVYNDAEVINACVWGEMAIGSQYTDEVYAFVEITIS
jgi:hypothetical protein